MYHSCYGTEEEKELNEFLPAALREFVRLIRADSTGEFTRQVLIFATEVVERHGDDMFACGAMTMVYSAQTDLRFKFLIEDSALPALANIGICHDWW